MIVHISISVIALFLARYLSIITTNHFSAKKFIIKKVYLRPSAPFIRYTPYFFDKNMLDNILEESVDQHFQTLIQSRRTQRRRDVIDDNLAAEIIEESGENLWEPPEVRTLICYFSS